MSILYVIKKIYKTKREFNNILKGRPRLLSITGKVPISNVDSCYDINYISNLDEAINFHISKYATCINILKRDKSKASKCKAFFILADALEVRDRYVTYPTRITLDELEETNEYDELQLASQTDDIDSRLLNFVDDLAHCPISDYPRLSNSINQMRSAYGRSITHAKKYHDDIRRLKSLITTYEALTVYSYICPIDE